MRHVLVALVQDEPGVLARMASLFARRGYNIASFTAGASETPGLTRVTLVVEGTNTVLDQIAKQFRKLVEVVKVADLTDEEDYLAHEMMLVKVRVNSRTRQEVVSLADLFKARIIDVSSTTLVLEATGEADKLDKLLEVLKPFGVKEQARTGLLAMNRGAKILNQRPGVVSDRKYLTDAVVG
ncbi:MAG: acetolactate synthase small subunit [Dehalococcoidales bacterium]|nr:acetolactate synthase small subunit [Dehalococcoidales bacterium]